ncbi:uncharacterized protein M6B38_166155 [Iris pallida]|uniref:RanBP2-type domain-containing protein n=1 Tax=Iris pallida TaxID=29817 RepID=A0AAX6DRD8_IRIPA|nr:Uncharacterized protein M6B38_232265 [Iris pallida]KAJ6808896.1 uncharacterized protein M6B38_166155 [Iris pallida]
MLAHPFRPLSYSFLPLFRFPKMSSSCSSSSCWSCSKCTYLNSPSNKTHCMVCLSSSSSSSSWSCLACTFSNPSSSASCQMCLTAPSSSVVEIDLDPEDVSDISAVPSAAAAAVPSSLLRRCGTKRPASPGQQAPAEKVLRKEEEAPAYEGSGLGHSSEDGILKILSYNVWFREDLELHKRMKAIGDLILQHSPDIICLQEVTPEIYDILQNSEWWKTYKCSVSRKIATQRAYFCMQMSKLPVKAFSCKPFDNTVMGRELCLVEVDIGVNKKLVIATSHLESPCPGPPRWDQMYSKERVAQAKMSVDLLRNYPNVIFCGDMNWDDKLDGAFPIEDGWIDAWMKLRSGEIGWTYDTKANKMLSGNRKLQKRLDRFLCNLKDFKVDGIDMIGIEPIPGLSYQKQVGRTGKELVLPVLPSDHFGLLLTIQSL